MNVDLPGLVFSFFFSPYFSSLFFSVFWEVSSVLIAHIYMHIFAIIVLIFQSPVFVIVVFFECPFPPFVASCSYFMDAISWHFKNINHIFWGFLLLQVVFEGFPPFCFSSRLSLNVCWSCPLILKSEILKGRSKILLGAQGQN